MSAALGASTLSLFQFAEPADPGLGATVPTPPPAVLIAGWVVGIIALAILWAASRR